MLIRRKMYYMLVNKYTGIGYRYHKVHDGAKGFRKILSWFYLLWLNFGYYCLFLRFLGKMPEVEIYESKSIPIKESESALFHREVSRGMELCVDAYVDRLSKYEIVSFDIFDTLIFRPFSLPVDLFRIVGEKLGILDFTNIRIRAEWDARMKCKARYGHMEVTLADIYDNLEEDVGISSEWGQTVETEAELSLCYANPFMLEVWKKLAAKGKRMIVVSDMYLSSEVLSKMLTKNGFIGFEKLYVSCEYGRNKVSGNLYQKVLADLGLIEKRSRNQDRKSCKLPPYTIIHVGDNEHSDQNMAKANGIDNLLYPRIDKNAMLYRAYDMSFMVGSAYRGLVTNHLYNGLHTYSMEYEYGYIYGGLFVTGYCSFIHDYCRKNGIDKLLFLSRDGDVLKRAYDIIYPEERGRTEYVYWSRKAATILMANEDKHDYFRRFIYHKLNQGYTIADILKSMELGCLITELKEWKDIWIKRIRREETDAKGLKFVDLNPEEELTEKNGDLLRKFIEAKWDKVLAAYETDQRAAKKYYNDILHGISKAVAVDIGWAGSGAMALSHLTERVWEIPCRITGIIAGTNTMHNLEPDASEPFLQSGRLVAYLFSQQHNRDLLKKHDLNKDYNVFWELLLSSPTPQFAGFYDGRPCERKQESAGRGTDVYNKTLDITLHFGSYDANVEGIRAIQQGIMDFVKQYWEHFRQYPYMFNISGRDAYAPMLVAASHQERYLKVMKRKFDLRINVD